ncbi:ThuA domain-containing protein [Caenibius sp. WL]|uniref:ThuA domain-containing protein n=1 Tax=Caenibius sp. WL TaxID=2872646 RepID=UPI001C998F4A|nr:ThuA domain-containing protein [Caenibius sp. WL]QZP07677.1 ThuA domain-containing protein [Caenibius sp. WL]
MAKVGRIILWILAGLLALIAITAAVNWDTIQRVLLGGVKVYETTPPKMPAAINRPAILIFSKTNGYRDDAAVAAGNALFASIARKQGWGHFQTENGATFSPDILKRFDAVVFNNVSGDVFTPEQRSALKAYIENGGGFVAVHGAGGDHSYDWKWYVNELIGAQFIGHTMNPQFPQATLRIEDTNHPATAGMKPEWIRSDEWYAFDKSPREKGYHILVSIDESTYEPKGLFGQDVSMGKDHPMVWWHCQGKGRALYSALGHRPEAYAEPQYQAMLLGATEWALRLKGDGCETPAPPANPAKAGN